MNKIDKALKKLNSQERSKLKKLLLKIDKNDLVGIDLRKLKGYKNIFRVRWRNLRIIFRKLPRSNRILHLEHRTDTTYKKSHL